MGREFRERVEMVRVETGRCLGEWVQTVQVETGMGCFRLHLCQKVGYVKEPQVVEIRRPPLPNLSFPLPHIAGVALARTPSFECEFFELSLEESVQGEMGRKMTGVTLRDTK